MTQTERSQYLIEVPEAIDLFRAGQPLIVVDDEDRENEGDIVIAAEKITPEWVNFMAMHGRGLVCLTLTEQRATELDQQPLAIGRRGDQRETRLRVEDQ